MKGGVVCRWLSRCLVCLTILALSSSSSSSSLLVGVVVYDEL